MCEYIRRTITRPWDARRRRSVYMAGAVFEYRGWDCVFPPVARCSNPKPAVRHSGFRCGWSGLSLVPAASTIAAAIAVTIAAVAAAIRAAVAVAIAAIAVAIAAPALAGASAGTAKAYNELAEGVFNGDRKVGSKCEDSERNENEHDRVFDCGDAALAGADETPFPSPKRFHALCFSCHQLLTAYQLDVVSAGPAARSLSLHAKVSVNVKKPSILFGPVTWV